MDSIAIDVGYGFTKYAWPGGKKDKGPLVDSFQSVASPVRGQEFKAPSTESLGAMIDVDGTGYYTGHDVATQVEFGIPSNTSTGFVLSPAYRALYRGALYQICKQQSELGKELRIKHAAVGLPLTTFLDFKDQLEAFSRGVHLIPHPHRGATLPVTIDAVTVMLQPMGVLVGALPDASAEEVIAIVDVGSGTTDVVVVVDGTPNFNRSGSFELGLNKMLESAVGAIDRGLLDSPAFMGRMHRALRAGEASVKQAGKDYPMVDLYQAMAPVADRIMDKVAAIAGIPGDIERIVVAGGGAQLFSKALTRKYPNMHDRVRLAKDPVFSAVRGFYFVAEEEAAAARDAA